MLPIGTVSNHLFGPPKVFFITALVPFTYLAISTEIGVLVNISLKLGNGKVMLAYAVDFAKHHRNLFGQHSLEGYIFSRHISEIAAWNFEGKSTAASVMNH